MFTELYSLSKELNTPFVWKAPSNGFNSATWNQFAAVERNGIKWFQIVVFFCASVLLERLFIVILGHFFGRNGRNA